MLQTCILSITEMKFPTLTLASNNLLIVQNIDAKRSKL